MFKDLTIYNFIKVNAGLLAVVSISIVFIITRLSIPIFFDGSYIDEYWHITSGISLFESGNYAYFYNDKGGYDRGLLMSLWVGFLLNLLGKSILVAKLAPFSIAVINYFLFLYLSIKLFDKRRFQFLLLLLYVFSPWLIFNHTYIRFYIVNELFLLILLVLGYQLYYSLKDQNWKNISLFLSLIIILNILILVTVNDKSQFMLIIATAMMIVSLFIYEFNMESKTNQGLISAISGNVLLSSIKYRSALVLVVAIIGFIMLDMGSKIEFLLHGQLRFTSSPDRKYLWFFLVKNGIISLFFVLAVTTFWLNNKGYERIILPLAGTLFLIHIVSSKDLQIIRGIMYFIPLYYIAAIIGLSKLFRLSYLSEQSKWRGYIVISCIFLIATVTNVSKNFYLRPHIAHEISYIEYAKVYDAVAKNCQGQLIIEASPSSPFVANFYNIAVDFALSATGDTAKDRLYYTDPFTGKFKTVWGDLLVITDIKDLKLLDSEICLIVRGPSEKRFIPSTAKDILENVESAWHYQNIVLYLLDKDILTSFQ